MFLSTLKTAFRSLRFRWLFSLINMIGLTIGIISIILIIAWINDELSYDKFHRDAERIYRVEALMDFQVPTLWASTQAPLSENIRNDFPEIEQSVRLKHYRRPLMLCNENPIIEENFFYADKDLFNLFTIGSGKKDYSEALKEPFSLLISERMAKKYFGDENPVGKIMEVDRKHLFTIKGVFDNYPPNSHLQFDFIASFSTLKELNTKLEDWGRFDFLTYIKISEDADINSLREKIKLYLRNFIPDCNHEYNLEPLTGLHFHHKYGEGNMVYIWVFSGIGLLILIVAFINFVNISTARALERTKEIAIRKTQGATRRILMQQIYTELAVVTLISLIISIAVILYIVPHFNELAYKDFTIGELLNLKTMMYVVGLIMFAVVISGIYPAVYLSSFHPSAILGGEKHKLKGQKLRMVLVVFQFTISVVLIFSAFVIQKQLNYIRNKNLGFAEEQMVYVHMNYKSSEKFGAVKDKLEQLPAFKNYTFSDRLPLYVRGFFTLFQWDGNMNKESSLMVNGLRVDERFLDLYNIKVVKGRGFLPDMNNESCYIINEKAAKEMGLEDPVGKRVYNGDLVNTITGVVKDFHFKPLREEVAPMVITYDPLQTYLSVKLAPNSDKAEKLDELVSVVGEIVTDYPFTYGFVDDEVDNLYRAEMRIGKLVNIFTLFTIMASCLGLFGLSMFMVQSKTKEVAIRKTFGASVAHIAQLMTREMFIIIVLANILGGVAGYYIIQQWLDNFAYKTGVGSVIFILVFLFSMLLAMISVSISVLRLARTNPVETLKYE